MRFYFFSSENLKSHILLALHVYLCCATLSCISVEEQYFLP